MTEVKRSRKSRMKKRPEEWENLKQEIAKELGIWDKVREEGWSGLSAAESGRLGGVFSKRKRQLQEKERTAAREEADHPYGDADMPNVVYAGQAQAAKARAHLARRPEA